MSTATEKRGALNGKQRDWIKKMGGLLKTAKPAKGDDSSGGSALKEMSWELKVKALKELESMLDEFKDADLPQVATFRKRFDKIRDLEKKKDYDEASKAFDDFQPEFNESFKKFQKARSSGVKDLDEPSKKPSDAPAGGDAPADTKGGVVVPEAAPSDPNAAQYQKMILKVGSKGPAVQYLQKLLNANLKIDGAFGPATKTAVTGFQKGKALTADGVVGPKTWGALAGGGAPAAGAASGAAAAGAATPAKSAGGTTPAAPGAGTSGSPAGKASAGFISATVGKGGKNLPDDVKAVQEALNKRGGAKIACDGKCSPQTIKAIEEFQKKLGQFKPEGIIEPNRGTARALSGAAKIPPTPPEPKPIAPPDLGKATLDKGAFVWHSTRGILATNIDELKKGVRGCYGTEHKDLLTAIEDSMKGLSKVVDKLDTRLADALDTAYKAANEQARVAELKKAEALMKEYLKYVNGEPLIGHMDDNPFGVKTSLKKVISDALKHLSQLLPEATVTKS